MKPVKIPHLEKGRKFKEPHCEGEGFGMFHNDDKKCWLCIDAVECVNKKKELFGSATGVKEKKGFWR